ncbi:MAG: hypothetical protein ACI3VN_04520 [Candidatus Onthomonas sp.]
MNWSETVQKHNPFRNYKSFSHWFSYHWRPVVLVLLALGAGVYFALLPKDPESDYVVSWVCTHSLSDRQEQALTDQITAAGYDVNGDGQIVVRIDQYLVSFDPDLEGEALTESYGYLTKLLNAIQAGDCRLYFMDDPEGFQRTTGLLQYLDGSIPPETDSYECANWAEMCVPFQADWTDQTIYLGRRCLFNGENPEELFPGADALFTALTEN